MTPLEEQAASLCRDEIVALLIERREAAARNATLETRLDELTQQRAWFKRQLFGSKSERRLLPASDARQLALGEPFATTAPGPVPAITVPSHTRRRPEPQPTDADSVLRFDASVPVKEIHVPNPEIEKLPPDSYSIVDTKKTYRLAQERASYVVLCYLRDVVKLKKANTFSCPPAPPAVFEKCVADVSLLVGILLNKFVYYLPLYRQHQRMQAAGIHLGRSTLTLWVHRCIELLLPIYEAQWASVLKSQVLAVDETPMKAGRIKPRGRSPGKMKTGFFWPILGDRDEIVFPFSPSRAHAVVEQLLFGFKSVLLSEATRRTAASPPKSTTWCMRCVGAICAGTSSTPSSPSPCCRSGHSSRSAGSMHTR